jgi:molybdopterin adenylyltransferase
MIRIGILTVSDKGSRGERDDKSGETIREIVPRLNGEVARYEVVPDEKEIIQARLADWSDNLCLDLILTTGGTGLTPRDVTPEATLAVLEREIPGIAEVMRLESLKKTPHAMLSRAVAGQRRQTMIVNLPGSPKAVRECLEAILPALPHGIEKMKGDMSDCAPRE